MRTLEDIVAAMPAEQWNIIAARCDQLVAEARARQARRRRRHVAVRAQAQPMLDR